MTTKNKVLRFIIPVALALMVLFATGCDLLTNSGDDSAPAAVDPNALVLPAGTVQGWDSSAPGSYWVTYYGENGYTASRVDLGSVSVGSNASYPGQTIQRSAVENRLQTSNITRPAVNDRNKVFGFATPEDIISPAVDMIRVDGLATGDWSGEDWFLIRADGTPINQNQTGRNVIEWWYVSIDTTLNGTFAFWYHGGDATATNVQLTQGWNTMIFTATNPGWTVTTGSEPSGIAWQLQ